MTLQDVLEMFKVVLFAPDKDTRDFALTQLSDVYEDVGDTSTADLIRTPSYRAYACPRDADILDTQGTAEYLAGLWSHTYTTYIEQQAYLDGAMMGAGAVDRDDEVEVFDNEGDAVRYIAEKLRNYYGIDDDDVYDENLDSYVPQNQGNPISDQDKPVA